MGYSPWGHKELDTTKLLPLALHYFHPLQNTNKPNLATHERFICHPNEIYSQNSRMFNIQKPFNGINHRGISNKMVE